MLRKNVLFLLCSLVILNFFSMTIAIGSVYKNEIKSITGVKNGDKFEFIMEKFDYTGQDDGLFIVASKGQSFYAEEQETFSITIIDVLGIPERIPYHDESANEESIDSVLISLIFVKERIVVEKEISLYRDSNNVNSAFILPINWKYFQEIYNDDKAYTIDNKPYEFIFHYFTEKGKVNTTKFESSEITSVYDKKTGVLQMRYYSYIKKSYEYKHRVHMYRQTDYFSEIDFRIPIPIIVSSIIMMSVSITRKLRIVT